MKFLLFAIKASSRDNRFPTLVKSVVCNRRDVFIQRRGVIFQKIGTF